MRIAEVVGSVTLNRVHPTLAGSSLRLAIPLSLEELSEDRPGQAETLVVYDDLNAGVGSRIAISEGGEATQPFRPEMKPVDAYNAALLDAIELTPPRRSEQ